MRFHVDAWDPGYGSSVEAAEGGTSESTARIEPDLEVSADAWQPVPAVTRGDRPGAVLFVDGVLHVDARLWIEQPDVHPETGELLGTDAGMALCASYAAGVVCSCSEGAHLMSGEVQRGLFTGVAEARPIGTSVGTYAMHPVTLGGQDNPVNVLMAALQGRLNELEGRIAVSARASLAEHGVRGEDDLIVVDGPLRGRTSIPRALGYVKSHRASYLPPQLQAQVGRLAAGERTPVFLMGTSWDRHSWYLRLPGRPGAPWAGIVRLECSADVPFDEAVRLAGLSQLVLPRYASTEYKDTRAPQNLVPIAGLERELRRRLGHAGLLTRALRVAAAP